MTNLPRPSKLNLSNDVEKQVPQLINYLNILVDELERTLNRGGTAQQSNERVIADIGKRTITDEDTQTTTQRLVITYDNGEVKYIEL